MSSTRDLRRNVVRLLISLGMAVVGFADDATKSFEELGREVHHHAEHAKSDMVKTLYDAAKTLRKQARDTGAPHEVVGRVAFFDVDGDVVLGREPVVLLELPQRPDFDHGVQQVVFFVALRLLRITDEGGNRDKVQFEIEAAYLPSVGANETSGGMH